MSSNFEDWIGREQELREPIRAAAVEALAASLDLPAPREGDALPPGWQWLFFNPSPPRETLGVDGLPTHGDFMPPIELPRRMWAGNRIQYVSPLPIGAEAVKRSKIVSIERKTGKAGPLCFVTQEHHISSGGQVRIVEQHGLVFRAPPIGEAPTPPRHEEKAQWVETFTPDPVLLFRYSALTFNAHRIHYDQPYAREVEGYPDLVVHGPLTATLLHLFAQKHGGGRRLARFDLRAVNPLYVTEPFTLEGRAEGDALLVWARGPDGELAMSAIATFD
ncbi:MAG: MaoC family dehydratase N-terminal domain-containing protein [Hyphomonadaceae bacterium]|nr:MaoC family dehydratase N-terminal domain-containing protein [Hyphomonadaceae bacterium]